MKTLYTGGTFDLFHYGHINFLKKCKSIADKVVVSLNTDDFVTEFKRCPIMNYEERRISLSYCNYVDQIVPHSFGKDSKPTILSVKPDIIAVGDDWSHKDYYSQMSFTSKWLDDNDITLIYIPYTMGISTSDIISRIHER